MRRSLRNQSSSSSSVTLCGRVSNSEGEVTIPLLDTSCRSSVASSSGDVSLSSSVVVRRRRFLICRDPTSSSLSSNFPSSPSAAFAAGDSSRFHLSDLGYDDTYESPAHTASPHIGPRRFCKVLTSPQRTLQNYHQPLYSASPGNDGDSLFKRPSNPPAYRSKIRNVSTTSSSLGSESVSSPKKRRHPLLEARESMAESHEPVVKRRVSAAQVEKEVQALYTKARYLTNWVPRLHHNKKLIVEGDLLYFFQEYPGKVQERWKSTTVKERKESNLVLTRSAPYVLEGRLNYSYAQTYSTPQFIIQAFSDGFPENWVLYRDKWRIFNKQQSMNNSDLSSVSSSIETSNFVQSQASTRVSTVIPFSEKLSGSVDKEILKSDTSTNMADKVAEKEQRPRGRPRKLKEYEEKTLQVIASGREVPLKPLVTNPKTARKQKINSNILQSRSTSMTDKVEEKEQKSKKQAIKVKEAKGKAKKTLQVIAPENQVPLAQIVSNQKTVREQRTKSKVLQDRTACLADKVEEKEQKSEDPPSKAKESKRKAKKTSKVTIAPESKVPLKQPVSNPKTVKERKTKSKILSGATSRADKAKENEQKSKKLPSKVKEAKGSKGRAKNTLQVVAPVSQVPLEQLVSNPKTVRERKINSKILQGFNGNHDDDIFSMKTSHARRSLYQIPGLKPVSSSTSNKFPGRFNKPSDIVTDLFDSDSENDISIHSARTPIGNYMLRNRSLTPVPQEMPPNEVEEQLYTQQAAVNMGFKDHAYIHRKVKESRKAHKLLSTKPTSPMQFDCQPFPKKEPQPKNRTPFFAEPVLQLMNEVNRANEEEDYSDEYVEPYFSDESESNAGSLLHAPMGLLQEYQREAGNRRK